MVRAAALALVLLASACTADATVVSAEAPVPPGRDAERDAAPARDPSGRPVDVATPITADPVTPPSAAPAPGPTTGGAPVATHVATAELIAAPTTEVTCVASVDELPKSTHVDAADRRLSKGSVLVVDKAARRLMLFDEGRLDLCFKVGLGFAPSGHKEVQGDGRTPEGWYRTSDKPWSSFDNAIAIHYPNELDARAAAADGRIGNKTRDRIVTDLRSNRVPPQSTKLGGAVLIHGGGASSDWTLGCVALDDTDLLSLRAALPRGMRTDLLVLP